MRNSNQADDESDLFDLGCPTWLWENDKRQQQWRRRLSFLRVAASFGGRDVFSHSAPLCPPTPPHHTPLPRKLHGLIWQRQMKADGNQHVKNKTKRRMKDDETSSCWSFLLLASVGSLGVFLHHSRRSSPLPAGRQAMISGPRSRARPNTSIS